MQAKENQQRPQVVIIGAGFGGLEAARKLAHAPVDVLLIDRNNYHAFWPLLYQVATSGLEPQEIASPIRGLIRGWRNVRFQIAEVERIDFEAQDVITDAGSFHYDELVLSVGSTNNFFGLHDVEKHGFGFKELPEALAVRNHILMCFERATTITDPAQLKQLLTFVVVGGGPTGVEMAGAIAELIRYVLSKDYPALEIAQTRVLLVEMMDRVLPPFPAGLAQCAQKKLDRLGVELHLGQNVSGFDGEVLHLKDGTDIPTRTVIWAAGVQGAELTTTLGMPLERGRRVRVTPELRLPDRDNVWVLGDMAYLENRRDGKPYPQLATVAMQQGRQVAENLRRKLKGQPLQAFQYLDKGSLATVGRNFAVARIWRTNWSGFPAWLLWLGVHILYLSGIRNRLLVLLNWVYNYLTFDRAARAIFRADPGVLFEDPSAAATTPELPAETPAPDTPVPAAVR